MDLTLTVTIPADQLDALMDAFVGKVLDAAPGLIEPDPAGPAAAALAPDAVAALGAAFAGTVDTLTGKTPPPPDAEAELMAQDAAAAHAEQAAHAAPTRDRAGHVV